MTDSERPADPKAEQEAGILGFFIGDTIGHKNNKAFTGNIIRFCYNWEGVLYVIIEYSPRKFVDSFELANFNKLIF